MIKLMAISIAIVTMPFAGQEIIGNTYTATHLFFAKNSPANIFMITKREKQVQAFGGWLRSATRRTYVK